MHFISKFVYETLLYQNLNENIKNKLKNRAATDFVSLFSWPKPHRYMFNIKILYNKYFISEFKLEYKM